MTERLQAVLFDLDGLLIDSEPLWTVAETELFERLGPVPWSDEAKAVCMGHRLDAAVPLMLAYAGSDASVEDTAGFLLTRMVELFAAALPVRDGAIELLDELTAREVPLALVSSSYRVLVEAALETLGKDRFAVTLGGDEVTLAKPHPEPYLTAAAALGADPARCVVLEDSRAGVESALAAGMACVAVPELQVLASAPRLLVVDSLRDVDVAMLTELAGADC
jgi:HAD superfamily hydrolase (TIGR01509 family)